MNPAFPPPALRPTNRRTAVAAAGAAWLCAATGTPVTALASPSVAAALPSAAPFAPRPLVFPRDHGAHTDTRTEWWYVTGELASDQARDRVFGFQITFFRTRLGTAGSALQRQNGALAPKHLLFAHAAVTVCPRDAQAGPGQLLHAERLARWNGQDAPGESGIGPAGLFGGAASRQDTDIAINDWRLMRSAQGLRAVAATPRQPGRAKATTEAMPFAFDLNLGTTQALVLQGNQGWSAKGPDPGQASFYYSQPQLAVRGQLQVGPEALAVTGRAWLDHEWSEDMLHPSAVGWDWIGMNLQDGAALTAFRLRDAQGRTLWAGGSFRAAPQTGQARAPEVRVFSPQELVFEPQRVWVSPATRASYPVAWHIRTPVGSFTVRALVDNQELAGGATQTIYWEGISELLDARGAAIGRGYLEMTGYAAPIRL